MGYVYPVYQPFLFGNEKQYVNDCLDSTWISSKGKYIEHFEKKFAEDIGVEYATTVGNGTLALHAALLALNIKLDDEIIVPTFTYIASVNAISYMNAKPVFADSLPDTWQIDPILTLKNRIAKKYESLFNNSDVVFHSENKFVTNSFWMCSLLISKPQKRDHLRSFLSDHGIETRPLFYPAHTMNIYRHITDDRFPIAKDISLRGINLPSYPGLTDEDVTFIAQSVLEFVNNHA